ncbi:uncharacterized protein LOC127437467 isoform X1 [Myxocyprinus asiaticus]|uniref:uncharacterized protein LOC127437467 isoform X1 n=1 Tax=Myxocyprinus asiaticus TaxID=70543 RepID=UPI0022232BFC|nr:uncharacterized protein LOC127437467 isoform X1 [Myxocyprinus asiaticus]
MEKNEIVKLHTSDSRDNLLDKESVFSAGEFIPSSPGTLGSEQHFCEGCQKGPESDLQFTTQTPTLTFTESTLSQRPSEINQETNSLDPQHNAKKQKPDLFFQNQDKFLKPAKTEQSKNKGFDHEEQKRDHEKIMSLRLQETQRYGHDDGIPAVVITQTEEVSSDLVECISENMTLTKSCHTASPSDGTELNSSDLQSLKSDTISLISEAAISSKSNEGPEEDARSIAASSVMSLFHRIQMDPVEREWLWCAALGNASALYVLLEQDPTLVSKKTALHWAAKQGHVEIADMMARSGADINQRAGYTALHLASLHGHDHIIRHLINNYNAKVNIRDYHGKIAAHYWNGSMDIFNKLTSQSAGRWSRGRRTQCYAQLSSLLSHSRTHGSINVEIRAGPLEPTPLSRSPSS